MFPPPNAMFLAKWFIFHQPGFPWNSRHFPFNLPKTHLWGAQKNHGEDTRERKMTRCFPPLWRDLMDTKPPVCPVSLRGHYIWHQPKQCIVKPGNLKISPIDLYQVWFPQNGSHLMTVVSTSQRESVGTWGRPRKSRPPPVAALSKHKVKARWIFPDGLSWEVFPLPMYLIYIYIYLIYLHFLDFYGRCRKNISYMDPIWGTTFTYIFPDPCYTHPKPLYSRIQWFLGHCKLAMFFPPKKLYAKLSTLSFLVSLRNCVFFLFFGWVDKMQKKHV